jgi:hypothetical protein
MTKKLEERVCIQRNEIKYLQAENERQRGYQSILSRELKQVQRQLKAIKQRDKPDD